MVLSCSKESIGIIKMINDKNISDFYCLSCLHSFRARKIELHRKLCDNRDFCNVIILSEDTNISEFNRLQCTMPHQVSPLSFFIQFKLREATDFLTGYNYPQDVSLPSFLVYL